MSRPSLCRPLSPPTARTATRRAAIRRAAIRLLAALLLLAAATPSLAYVVFLKDGSQITTKEKYKIVGDKAILTLPSGTETSYEASQIDVKRTEEFNQLNLGTARLIESKPSSAPAAGGTTDRPTLRDLLSQRDAGLAMPEASRRPGGAAAGGADKPAPRPDDAQPHTRAGFLDLMAMPRNPYPNTKIMGEVMKYLKSQGIDNVRVFRGSQSDRPLVEIVAASEASVFKALKDSANGLVQIHERFPKEIEAFELLLLTDSQIRAGQFTLTPELASQLVTEEVDPPSFFLRYVEF